MQHIHQEHYDAVIGFNKMQGLDVYYAADPCFAAKAAERSFLYRMVGRTRSFLAAEKAVFGVGKKTHILLISPEEQKVFSHIYGTDAGRMHLLPPGVQRDRLVPENYKLLRKQTRLEQGLSDENILLLMVGSGFKKRGLIEVCMPLHRYRKHYASGYVCMLLVRIISALFSACRTHLIYLNKFIFSMDVMMSHS